jgi:hypothetical protein
LHLFHHIIHSSRLFTNQFEVNETERELYEFQNLNHGSPLAGQATYGNFSEVDACQWLISKDPLHSLCHATEISRNGRAERFEF